MSFAGLNGPGEGFQGLRVVARSVPLRVFEKGYTPTVL